MRDSALKQLHFADLGEGRDSRRRAHARQRFETPPLLRRGPPGPPGSPVGEELMRDSALKQNLEIQRKRLDGESEKSSCATAL